jgi:hypothetical protein
MPGGAVECLFFWVLFRSLVITTPFGCRIHQVAYAQWPKRSVCMVAPTVSLQSAHVDIACCPNLALYGMSSGSRAVTTATL